MVVPNRAAVSYMSLKMLIDNELWSMSTAKCNGVQSLNVISMSLQMYSL